MLAFIIIIIALGILGLVLVLYKVLLEEGQNIEEDRRKEKEEKIKKRKESYMGQVEDKGLEAVIASVKNKPIEIDRLKSEIQAELRKASKAGNREKVREYNEMLKKIDESI